jgi:hypothetical protein
MSDGIRVLVCGGRHYRDNGAVFGRLNILHADKGIAVIIHGSATGADALAEKWAVANDVPIMALKADWNAYGRAAGPIRNRKMLTEGRPDLVLAFPGGDGTADMVRQAEDRGFLVERYRACAGGER